MTRESYDAVVIGGGIIGTATAHFLAAAGQDVCVIEKSVIALESSGRCAGLIKQSFQPDFQRPIAMRAMQLWRQLADESDLDFQYREHGYVRLAWDEEDAAHLATMVEHDRADGIDVRLLSMAEAKDLIPYVEQRYVAAAWAPPNGSAEPYLATVAMSRAARRLGVTIHEYTEVTGIEVANSQVSGVLTTRGPLSTGVVVNATNAWAPAIGRMVGLELPIEVKRSSLVVTEPLPPFIGPVVTTERYGYFVQTASGNVAIGYPAAPQQGFDRRAVYEALTVASRRSATLIPRLAGVSILRVHTGFTVWTPDWLALVGPVTRLKGFYVAAAFCGLGFQIGPAVGEAMAELILHGRTSVPIDAYRPERFNIYASSRTD